MNICVIGTGYVGLVAGVCFANFGHNVICVDNDAQKIENLKKGIVPIFEQNLEDLIKKNVSTGRLSFSDDISFAVKNSIVCYIAVGTPESNDGHADLNSVFDVAQQIAKSIDSYKVVVIKSTVPVGTAHRVESIIKNQTNAEFDVVSNPEFLRQGVAINDFISPDRVIIGSNSARATKIMEEIYADFNAPIVIMDVKSSEMTKYASNSFLAMKISFANEIANICDKTGADVKSVLDGMSFDKRIGSSFLSPGLGFGGSCFPKDVKALYTLAQDFNYDAKILKSVDFVNVNQSEIFIQKIKERFADVSGLKFCVLGVAFKPETNDIRQAPSVSVIKSLLNLGANVVACDPKALDSAKKIFKDEIEYEIDPYKALKNADSLLLITQWQEFLELDFQKVSKVMKQKIIFDGRNVYNAQSVRNLGFEYFGIGCR